MVGRSIRRADNGNREHKHRSAYEKYKLIIVLIGALGGGSVAGIGVKFYNTNEVNETPARVEVLRNRVDDYISSHAREAELNTLLLKQTLNNIEEDMKEMKEEVDITHDKLDVLTRLIRSDHLASP